MSLKRPNTLYAGAGAAAVLAAMALLPASMGSAAELIAAPTLTYDLESTTPTATFAVEQTVQPAAQIANAGQPAEAAEVAEFDEASHVCVAKVVMHEAGNQSRAGKIAVAQTLVNRLKAGRFGESICSVANQPGQYFDLSGYRPNRDSDNWADAMDVAHDVLGGEAEPVAPGALFFRANYAPTNSFFRGRKRITEVGAHVFYR